MAMPYQMQTITHGDVFKRACSSEFDIYLRLGVKRRSDK